MKGNLRFEGCNDYLKRLPPEHYRGDTCVHWSMTIGHRKVGWLVPIFYYKFREILTHTLSRYSLCCPVYCCMPDHIHLLWLGILGRADQRLACRYFRRQLNPILERLGVHFQQQTYDRVLREDERERSAFEDVEEYIARNPERSRLVKRGEFRKYPYTDCLVPGYPELALWQTAFGTASGESVRIYEKTACSTEQVLILRSQICELS